MRAAAALFALLAGSAVSSGAEASEKVCYDLKVEATPIVQLPSEYPAGDPNVIVMEWPWFVDLKIKRVLEGTVPSRSISTLAVLHSAMPAKKRVWLLRRNTAGSYNVIRPDPATASRCGPGVAEAEPYLVPPIGKTYKDLRREAEAEFDRIQKEY